MRQIRIKNRKKNKRKILSSMVKITIACIVLVSCFEVKAILKAKREDDNIQENYIVLQNLEKENIASVEEKIKEKQVNNSYDDEVRDYSDEDEEYENKNEYEDSDKDNDNKDEKEKDNKSNRLYFDDSVFMGDSLTEPLDYYNVLNKSSVLAKKGQDVVKAKEAASKLADIKPKRVFLLYGVNDLDLFKDSKEFKDKYTDLVEKIKEEVPDAKIYIQSLTPIQDKAQEKNENYSQDRIDDFGEKVKEVANEQNVKYINIKDVLENRDDLYEPDGIHFKKSFYNVWLDYLKDKLENNN